LSFSRGHLSILLVDQGLVLLLILFLGYGLVEPLKSINQHSRQLEVLSLQLLQIFLILSQFAANLQGLVCHILRDGLDL
jgi:hypothetical protein